MPELVLDQALLGLSPELYQQTCQVDSEGHLITVPHTCISLPDLLGTLPAVLLPEVNQDLAGLCETLAGPRCLNEDSTAWQALLLLA